MITSILEIGNSAGNRILQSPTRGSVKNCLLIVEKKGVEFGGGKKKCAAIEAIETVQPHTPGLEIHDRVRRSAPLSRRLRLIREIVQ